MPRHRHPTTLIAALALVVGITLAGAPVSAAPSAPSAPDVPVAAESSPVPWFDGSVDEFYVVPAPLPAGEPGELIRVQPISTDATATTVRIMYHSTDGAGRDRAVTGRLTYPNRAAPEGGWPVVSHANGTVGMASQCAPSRGGAPVWTVGLDVVAVASDYIGLGPVGERHPYLGRVSAGNAVTDAVRAARNLPEAAAGTTWVAIGGSQGGHGALSTNELGADRAPELDLRGTVSMAPAAMFDRVYGGIDVAVTRVVGAMGLYGLATEHPELDPHDYVSEAGQAAEATLDSGCLPEIILAILGVPLDEYYDHDPIETEPARSLVLANDVGNVAVDAPVFLVQGTADTTVVPERTRDLFDRMCGVGQSTRLLEVEGADHGNVAGRAFVQIRDWLQARLDGVPAEDGCPAGSGPTRARFSAELCQKLDLIGPSMGLDRAGVVRFGIDVFRTLDPADHPAADIPVDHGPCVVDVAWDPSEEEAIRDLARTWGMDVGTLHHAGGRIVLRIIYALAMQGRR